MLYCPANGYNIGKKKGVLMMNQFCKKFFTVYFTVSAAAMVLLTCGFVSHLMHMAG